MSNLPYNYTSPANKIWISINYISVDFHMLISQLVNTCHYRDYDFMNTQTYFGSECVGSHEGNSADICVFLETFCKVNFSMRGQLFMNLALFSVSEHLDRFRLHLPVPQSAYWPCDIHASCNMKRFWQFSNLSPEYCLHKDAMSRTLVFILHCYESCIWRHLHTPVNNIDNIK